jgi:hypothetical protein
MEELNRILSSYVVSNEETKGKLPGAALVVVNKGGQGPPKNLIPVSSEPKANFSQKYCVMQLLGG